MHGRWLATYKQAGRRLDDKARRLEALKANDLDAYQAMLKEQVRHTYTHVVLDVHGTLQHTVCVYMGACLCGVWVDWIWVWVWCVNVYICTCAWS